jgi:hypothetical protein
MSHYSEITTFIDLIDLIDSDTLVVLDIDETVIEYPGIDKEYWYNLFGCHYHILKDYDLAEKACEYDWTEYIKRSKPSYTDNDILKFFDKVFESSAEMIYLTARSCNLSSSTVEHFKELNIPNPDKIYYNAKEKGPKLKMIIDTYSDLKKSKIIFVDDLDKNLVSMKETFGKSVKCFKKI